MLSLDKKAYPGEHKQKRNTGILRCAQDDDEKQAMATVGKDNGNFMDESKETPVFLRWVDPNFFWGG